MTGETRSRKVTTVEINYIPPEAVENVETLVEAVEDVQSFFGVKFASSSRVQDRYNSLASDRDGVRTLSSATWNDLLEHAHEDVQTGIEVTPFGIRLEDE